MTRPPGNGVDAKSPIEARKRSLLSELERALFDALAESPEVQRSIWRLQRAGFTLDLKLACREARPGAAAARPPAGFRIDADDLAFLHSIGIDPTRRARRRRPA
jgi:hypothetical protein